MEKFDYWGILVDSGSIVQWKHIRDVKKVYLQYTMSSCSYYTEHILLKIAKLEFENHKNEYFSWLLLSEHVKTNIFGNHMTTLTF